MPTSLRVDRVLAADSENGTPERLSGDDKVETLSALPRGPLSDPAGDDKVPEAVSAFHSEEGEAETLSASALGEGGEADATAGRRGRPKEFTAFHKAQVCGMIGAGMSQRQAAQYLGFSPSIVSQTLRRDKKFAADVAQAVASAKFQPLYNVIQASKRSWRAAVWLLKHAQPHTDLADRDARRAARKAEKLAAEEAIRERDRRRQRQRESDEEVAATLKRWRRDC